MKVNYNKIQIKIKTADKPKPTHGKKKCNKHKNNEMVYSSLSRALCAPADSVSVLWLSSDLIYRHLLQRLPSSGMAEIKI